jgi:hypothetical protein
MSWRPLLTGEPASRAWRIIDDIADTLADTTLGDDGSLLSGSAGRAIFHAYLARARGDDATQIALAEDALAHASEWLGGSEVGPGLFVGFTGVAWTLSHLPGRVLPPNEDDPAEEIDEVLESLLAESATALLPDLLYGLVGIGLYALERLPRPRARRILAAVFGALEAQATVDDTGACWWQRESDGTMVVNLGVAHGTPAVAAVLAGAAAAGVGDGRATPLAEAAMRWWLARCTTAMTGGLPLHVDDQLPPKPARPSWCYGSPGVAGALATSAAYLSRDDWRERALSLARHAAACPPDRIPIVDACLCHGSSALAHLYGRLQQRTGDPVLGEAARFWLERTLNMQRPSGAGWLEGSSGVGLTLLAAVSDVEPAWDRLLIASPVSGPGELH